MDVDNLAPKYLFISNAAKHENDTLTDMKLKKGDIVAFDKEYCNYEHFQQLTDLGIYFVTRLKDNAKYKVPERNDSKAWNIMSDQIIKFSGVAVSGKCSPGSAVQEG